MRVAKWLRRSGIARALCIFVIALLVWLRAGNPPVLQELRQRTFDFFQALHPRIAKQHPVLIVDIDEKSLRALGQWPWPRTRVADLVNKLTEAGAAVIGFDILFSEPDRLSPQWAAETFRGLDAETKEKLRLAPDNDQVLAEALKRSHAVLGETGLPNPVPESQSSSPIAGVATFGDVKPFLFKFPGLLHNTPALDAVAAGRGMLSIRTERDGIVRRVPMVMLAQGQIRPSLTLEMLRVVDGAETILVRSDEAGVKSVAIPGFEIPTDVNAQLWIHFSGHDPKRFVSAYDVLENRVPASAIADKLVLIGTSATGLLDSKTTPVDAIVPGVEVHAEILESALAGDLLSLPNYASAIDIMLATAIGLAIIIFAPLLGPATLMLLGFSVLTVLLGTTWYFFTQRNLLIDVTFPILTSLVVYIILVFAKYGSEQAQRRRIRAAFGQYMSPVLVERLAQSPEKLVLGGEQRRMSIMFSDVRGFTTISEVYRDDPAGLTALMNRLLNPLTNAIIERKGTIDKYIGDAIMAFWNAPLDDEKQEINACAAALDMIDRLKRLNEEREREAADGGHPFIPVHIGVGINTGSCVVGNMGSDLRFDYSVLGDAVNLASRLEGQTKNYGMSIIIGQNTAQAAKDAFAMIEVDKIAVKGKTQPETAFALLGGETMAASEEFRRLRDLAARMIVAYRAKEWDAAETLIHECKKEDSENRLESLLTLYAERIRTFRSDPPPADWDGVFVSRSK
jgi:adenylate cyclase